MISNYALLTRTVLILVGFALHEYFGDYIKIEGIYFILGILMFPLMALTGSRSIITVYPWEFYIFLGLVVLSRFIEVDTGLLYCSAGYLVSRVLIYFKVRDPKKSD